MTCRICFSEYRDEILTLWKRGILRQVIYDKYKEQLKYKGTLHSFRMLIGNHLRNHKGIDEMVIPQGAGVVRHTMETIADRFTDLLGKKMESMKPEDVSVKDYAAAHRVVVESKKLNLQAGAMALQLGKLFGPTIIEGEEANGIRPDQDLISEPPDPQ